MTCNIIFWHQLESIECLLGFYIFPSFDYTSIQLTNDLPILPANNSIYILYLGFSLSDIYE